MFGNPLLPMAPFMRARKMGERRKTNVNSDNSVMCSGSGDTEQGTGVEGGSGQRSRITSMLPPSSTQVSAL